MPQERIGSAPAWQWLGAGEDSITLSGVSFPAYRGGTRQAEALRAKASSGEPQQLMDGSGRVLGAWVVRRIEETRSDPVSTGEPRRIEYRVELSLHSALSRPGVPVPAIAREDSGAGLEGSAARADFERIQLLRAPVREELAERLSLIDKARALTRKGLSRLDALDQVAGERAQDLYELLDRTGLGEIPRRLWGPSEMLALAPDVPGDPRDLPYLRGI